MSGKIAVVLGASSLVVAMLAFAIAMHLRSPAIARPALVPVVSTAEVLRLIGQGKRVVFVDARESEEYAEERIPGAINLTLREVQSLDAKTLGSPDLVVAYCLKDFRGFEVARALESAGVPHVHTLQEMGISGWKRAGLPTRRAGQVTQVSAVTLQDCARNVIRCVRRSQ